MVNWEDRFKTMEYSDGFDKDHVTGLDQEIVKRAWGGNTWGKEDQARYDEMVNEAMYSATVPMDSATVPIEDFEALLRKLEGSKMRQQRQKSVEGRRDIYSQGLASMMSNF